MERTSPQYSVLSCDIVMEYLNEHNSVLRRLSIKPANLRLVRNEFREMYLEVQGDKYKNKYALKGINVRKKFMSEGKASISFPHQKMVLLITNAPPNSLLGFLRTMYIKLNRSESDLKVGARTKLLSGNVIEDISPVTLQELKEVKSKAGINSTPPTGKKRLSSNSHDIFQRKKLRMSSGLELVTLTEEQKEVLNAALAGKSIFFTGSAGTGKSLLLRRIIGSLPPDATMATASTGVAACHIGGVTLHSFAGIGSGQAPLQRCIELASRPHVQQAWRKCRHLIIDEISMVDGAYFEKLEHVARVVMGNDRPFGGMQLILCGDFLQLPPVSRNEDMKNGPRFCFQSQAWERCINATFELKQVHRQSDPVFISILQNIRIGRVTSEIKDQLLATASQKIECSGILATRLCSHTQDADAINTAKLNELPGESKTFAAIDSDVYSSKILDQMTPVASSVSLKIGAQVMLMKNINVGSGLVNGARGVVTMFGDQGLPVVRFCSKQEVTLKFENFTVKTGGGVLLSRKQIPIRLAWAFSIHKSQGLTLDCVEMSLARVFEPGQAYVALSRAKALKSLRVLDFDSKHVWANTEVLSFYKRLRRNMELTKLIPLGSKKV